MVVVNVAEFTERRQAQRYRLALPVELEHGTGRTRDISSSGVFFVTKQTVSLGEQIRLTLTLTHMEPDNPPCVQCQGVVVRVERYDRNLGVAVAFTEYRFSHAASGQFEIRQELSSDSPPPRTRQYPPRAGQYVVGCKASSHSLMAAREWGYKSCGIGFCEVMERYIAPGYGSRGCQ